MAASIYTKVLPSGKTLSLTVDFRGIKEQNIHIQVGEDFDEYKRNNVEATPVDGDPNHYVWSGQYGPWEEDKTISIAGQSKDCHVGNDCSNHLWYDQPIRIDSETSTSFHAWWDDSNDPPQNKNIDLKGQIA